MGMEKAAHVTSRLSLRIPVTNPAEDSRHGLLGASLYLLCPAGMQSNFGFVSLPST